MAPRRKPLSQLRRSARNYRLNPKSRLKKNAAQRRRNKTTENKKYRAELNRARRKAGEYGKGGKDFSHTKSGRIVRENSSTNRARNRGRK
tara:strand:- start:1123 stop:1392 length:270 start_codon:yes stop_codon:yes gene_type:complete